VLSSIKKIVKLPLEQNREFLFGKKIRWTQKSGKMQKSVTTATNHPRLKIKMDFIAKNLLKLFFPPVSSMAQSETILSEIRFSGKKSELVLSLPFCQGLFLDSTSVTYLNQGCQMAHFRTQNPIWVNLGVSCNER
jgi:hypothetical protein